MSDTFHGFTSGFDEVAESIHFERLLSRCYAGTADWVRDIDAVLSSDVTYQKPYPGDFFSSDAFYNYTQNTSSACSAISCCLAVSERLHQLAKLGKPAESYNLSKYRLAFVPAWNYAIYHAFIDGDYGYGGCSISGMMMAINDYGLLPYSAVGGDIWSDKELVSAGWNRRSKFNEIYEKYKEYADKRQVVTTIVKTAEQLLAVLDRGIPVCVGGYMSGHATHFYKDEVNGYIHVNDWGGSNNGKRTKDELISGWRKCHGGSYGILDIE